MTDRRQGQIPLSSLHERWLSRNVSTILKAFEGTPDLPMGKEGKEGRKEREKGGKDRM